MLIRNICYIRWKFYYLRRICMNSCLCKRNTYRFELWLFIHKYDVTNWVNTMYLHISALKYCIKYHDMAPEKRQTPPRVCLCHYIVAFVFPWTCVRLCLCTSLEQFRGAETSRDAALQGLLLLRGSRGWGPITQSAYEFIIEILRKRFLLWY